MEKKYKIISKIQDIQKQTFLWRKQQKVYLSLAIYLSSIIYLHLHLCKITLDFNSALYTFYSKIPKQFFHS